jgi:DNA primase
LYVFNEENTTGEHQRYSIRNAIETIKTAVLIEQVAAEYGKFKLLGNGRLLGRCVALDHEDRTPSMTVFTDSQKFRCYGCGVAGDVLDLEEIGGRHVETWTAVVALADRYGVELPQRPERWHSWHDEKQRRHKMIREALTRSYQRRYFRVFGGYLQDIGDPREREDEARRFFEDLRTVAVVAAENRMSR